MHVPGAVLLRRRVAGDDPTRRVASLRRPIREDVAFLGQFSFRDGIAESSGLSLVEAVASITLGLFGVRDILAGAGLITFGSRFGL